MEKYIVELENISKSFPGVKALDNVSFNLRPGEVHALLGENGAGKSTLMKIISGIYQKDSGVMKVEGLPVEFSNVAEASKHGIEIIHQELSMCRHLTVAQNIFLGREITKFGVIDTAAQREQARQALTKLGLDISPDTVVEKLPVSKQQMVEIAKATSRNTKILIMDEPTSSLTQREIDELFELVRELKKQGKGIIYISHRLEELDTIADRVTVLRDGRHIKTMNYSSTSISEIISLMVGREITEKFPRINVPKGDTIMSVKNLTTDSVSNITFDLNVGEIIGFAGLIGAGRTELVRALFGADKIISGEIDLHGAEVKIKSPRNAIKAGIVCAPEDRKNEGLFLKLSIRENIAAANLDRICSRTGVIRRKTERKLAQSAVDRLLIRTPSVEQDAKNLSGGNQQKVVVGKWLVRNASVVIFDEPTRGIDVGAKVEIYNLMNELKKSGTGVMFVSSELPEILGMSDRVIVMCSGKITGDMPVGEATQDKILTLATKFEVKA